MGNKYHNDKVEVQGVKFVSKKEARRWAELRLLERGKKISDLQRQVKFELIPTQRDGEGKVIERAVNYIADFMYYDVEKGKIVVEDTKGFKTPEYIIKRKLMLYIRGIRVVEI